MYIHVKKEVYLRQISKLKFFTLLVFDVTNHNILVCHLYNSYNPLAGKHESGEGGSRFCYLRVYDVS